MFISTAGTRALDKLLLCDMNLIDKQDYWVVSDGSVIPITSIFMCCSVFENCTYICVYAGVYYNFETNCN